MADWKAGKPGRASSRAGRTAPCRGCPRSSTGSQSRAGPLDGPTPADGRYTLAALTEAGWEKVVASAPGHVEQVRRMIFDPLTAAQVRQLGAIAGKIAGAVRSEMTRPSS